MFYSVILYNDVVEIYYNKTQNIHHSKAKKNKNKYNTTETAQTLINSPALRISIQKTN